MVIGLGWITEVEIIYTRAGPGNHRLLKSR